MRRPPTTTTTIIPALFLRDNITVRSRCRSTINRRHTIAISTITQHQQCLYHQHHKQLPSSLHRFPIPIPIPIPSSCRPYSLLRKLLPNNSEPSLYPTSPSSSDPTDPPKPKEKEGHIIGTPYPFPTRLLIYYSGRRIIYLACLKLCTLFVFTFAVIVAAPAVYLGYVTPPEDIPSASTASATTTTTPVIIELTEDELAARQKRAEEYRHTPQTYTLPLLHRELSLTPLQAGLLVSLSTILIPSIPLLLMVYVSPPYVTHLHITLPPHARFSASHLHKFLTNLPKSTPLEFTTIRWLGRPECTKVQAGQLRRELHRWGCANLVWRGTEEKTGRYREKLFYVDERGSPAQVPYGSLRIVGTVLDKVGDWQVTGDQMGKGGSGGKGTESAAKSILVSPKNGRL